MPSSKYHRQQASVLAGLALSTNDPTEANRFKLAAMEHLERAQALEDAAVLQHGDDLRERRAAGYDHVGLLRRQAAIDVDGVAEPERRRADDHAGAEYGRERDPEQRPSGTAHRGLRASHVSRIPTAAS